MSAYKGHRGPNVSQCIANLNTLSPTQDLPADPVPVEDDFSAFLNADFYDVNGTRTSSIDFTSPVDFNVDVDAEPTQPPKTGVPLARPTGTTSVDPTMDFSLQGDFHFTDFNNFGPTTLLDPSLSSLPQSQPAHYSLPHTYGSPTASITPLGQDFDSSLKKRKLDDDIPEHLDANARVAAEEDKRRRNTAASARFRVKKKQREQALEKTAKDMSDKVNILETRIQQLETENAWLKGLITEKNSGKSSSELIARLSKHEEGAGGRSSGAHTDGVGTKAEGPKADA
ncbi:bZIP transcription factor-like protein [Plenodomus tracheiphilus IPT5]|uniref:BZIP transcription factor-like protein n=1 Tax=Plenodomus tracheiphilus IPT5 TaxID=1408161 RepID=A0A6A7AW59_9PLEO|nr:bZIP transcription factor-like protein [Plenodomus tracheiphilus IPT5]